MGSRDHSYECAWCDEERGGTNNITCACDRLRGFRCGDYTVGDALGLRRRDEATTRCDVCQFQRGPRTECLCPGRARRLAESLRTLAANLAVGGALCESFRTGFDEGFDLALRHGTGAESLLGHKYERAAAIGDDDAHDWRPGCGRAWGG